MLTRSIVLDLLVWKQKKAKHPLLVEGARQVGKTTTIQTFIESEYDGYWVNINLIQRPDLCVLFEDDISPEGLTLKLKSLYPKLFDHTQRGVLFLDEIQQCPNAIVALKSFSLLNRFDVIASGSLLGVTYQQVSSFPVGHVERLTMYPLNFEEFIEAVDQTSLYQSVVDLFRQQKSIPLALHQPMVQLFRDFLVVGGMPEVVSSYVTHRDLNEVFAIQQRIVQDYQNDIAKYAISSDRVKAREVFDSIPAQLGKENKKFQYKHVRPGARSSLYDGSIQWLVDAGIAYRCHNLSALDFPLISYRVPNMFKVYLLDTGLLISMYGLETQRKILLNDIGVAKGALYENVIATQLQQVHRELYYYDRRSTLEVDFIIIYDGVILPIDVKAGSHSRSRSLSTLLSEGEVSKGLRLTTKQPEYGSHVMTIPVYLIRALMK
jgi:uncharacterized protein